MPVTTTSGTLSVLKHIKTIDGPVAERIREARKAADEKFVPGYLNVHEAFTKFFEQSVKNGKVHMEEDWGDHIRGNIESITKNGSIAKLINSGVGKIAIIIGASPELKVNGKDLLAIEGKYRDRFITIACISSMTYLEKIGVKPDLIIAADADPIVYERDIASLKHQEEYTLMLNTICNPLIAKNWRGKILWIPMECMDEKANDLLHHALGREFARVSGAGNQFNEAFAIAYGYFGCRSFFFVGNALSWKPEKGKTGNYYADGKKSYDENEDECPRFDALDVWGYIVATTVPHFQYKIWLEDFTSKFPGYYVNCTEGGILGVNTEERNYLPWIQQEHLKVAIDHAKKSFAQYESKLNDWRFTERVKYDLFWKQHECAGGYPEKTISSLGVKKVLEVGCGDGRGVQEMVNAGIDAYGVDISEVASSKWNGIGKRCSVSFADNMPFADREFDMVFTDSLEHFPPHIVGDSIREMKRVSDKYLLICNLTCRRGTELINNKLEPHATIRPPQWWRKEFRRNGFTIVKTFKDNFLLERRD